MHRNPANELFASSVSICWLFWFCKVPCLTIYANGFLDYTASRALHRILSSQDPTPHLMLSRITVLRLMSCNLPDITSHPSHFYPSHSTSASYKQWLSVFLNASPLLSYSYNWWSAHLLKAIDSSERLSRHSPSISHILPFFAMCKAFPALLNLGGRRGFDYLSSSAHLAAHHGLAPLIPLFPHHTNKRTRIGRTALTLAASQDHHATVEEILSLEGVDVNTQDSDGYTPLMAAAQNGCIHVIELLLDRTDVKVNLRGKEGQTALLCCISATLGTHDPHRVEVAQRLLSAPGVDVNIPDVYGTTALMKAVRVYPVHFLSKFITQYHVDLWKCDPQGRPILMYAWQADSETFRWIVNVPGVDATLKDESGTTALMSRAGSRVQQSSEDYLLDFTALVQAADNLNEKDIFGLTALCHAVIRSEMAAIEALLQLPGIDKDPQDGEGRSLLMLAVMHNRDSAMLHWLQDTLGAEINAVDNSGRSALMLAAQTFKFNADVVKSMHWILSDRTIKANAKANDGSNALFLALLGSVLGTMRTLLNSSEQFTVVEETLVAERRELLVVGKRLRYRLREVSQMKVILEVILQDEPASTSPSLCRIVASLVGGDSLKDTLEFNVAPQDVAIVSGEAVISPCLKLPWDCGWIAEELDAPVQLLLNHPGLDDCGFGYLRRLGPATRKDVGPSV